MNLLSETEVTAEQLEIFDTAWDSCADDNTELLIDNIACGKTLEIELLDVKVKSDTCCIGQICHKVIDGQYCLVIPTNRDILVGGVVVRS